MPFEDALMLLMFLAGLLVRHNCSWGGGAHRSTFYFIFCYRCRVSRWRTAIAPRGWRPPIGRLSVPMTSANGRAQGKLNLSEAPLSIKLYPLLVSQNVCVVYSYCCVQTRLYKFRVYVYLDARLSFGWGRTIHHSIYNKSSYRPQPTKFLYFMECWLMRILWIEWISNNIIKACWDAF